MASLKEHWSCAGDGNSGIEPEGASKEKREKWCD
jgi:hypothetical protein